jgi:hypothetical protein
MVRRFDTWREPAVVENVSLIQNKYIWQPAAEDGPES